MRQLTIVAPGVGEFPSDDIARFVIALAQNIGIPGDNIIVHQWDCEQDVDSQRLNAERVNKVEERSVANAIEILNKYNVDGKTDGVAYTANLLGLRRTNAVAAEEIHNAVVYLCEYPYRAKLFTKKFGLSHSTFETIKSLYDYNLV